MTKTVVGAGSEKEARRQASRAGSVRGRLLCGWQHANRAMAAYAAPAAHGYRVVSLCAADHSTDARIRYNAPLTLTV
jgi:hypothetical protein